MREAAEVLLVLGLVWPLVLAIAASLMARPLALLAWAPVPGLLAALSSFTGATATTAAPALLLGLTFQLDTIGAVFLGFGSLVWLLAGWFARAYMAESDRARMFSAFWLVTLAGTLATFTAADAISFYLSFTVLSLASYVLIVHERTTSAWRAGRIYIILAVIGETALIATLMLAVTEAGSAKLADIAAAIPSLPHRDLILAGVLFGLGIKAGLVPLHVWLPLAHPEAPTPASAVLSGVIVKAGIIGLLRFLPLDTTLPLWSIVLVTVGLLTAYYGVIVGLMQTSPKAILAYSTLSQMGLLVAVLGGAMATTVHHGAAHAVSLYALHHGLAKSALFLSIAVLAAASDRLRLSVLLASALLGLSIAGLPLTGGALAKFAIKDPLGKCLIGMLTTLSASGTTLLMLHFLHRLDRSDGRSGQGSPWGLIVPWMVLGLAAVTTPWLLLPVLTGDRLTSVVSAASLWSALWPILVAVVAVAAYSRWWLHGLCEIPPGDLVVIGERIAARIFGWRTINSLPPWPRSTGIAAVRGFAILLLLRAERSLQRWSVSGSAILVVGLLLIASWWTS